MFELRIGKSVVSVETAAEIQAFVDSGKATADTPIRKLGVPKWSRLQNVKGLRFPESSAPQTQLPPPIPASMRVSDFPPDVDTEKETNATRAPTSVSRHRIAIRILFGVILSATAIGAALIAVIRSNAAPNEIFEQQILLDLSDVPHERVFWEKDRDNIQITQVFWTPITWDVVETTSQRFPLTARVEHYTSVYVYDVRKHNVSLDEARSIVMEISPSRVNVRSQLDMITEKYSVILINTYGLNWNGDTVDASLIEVFRRMANTVDQKTISREYREKNRNTTREHKRNLSWIPCNVNGVEVSVLTMSYFSETIWMWDLENSKWEQQPGETSLYPYTNKLANLHSFDIEKEMKLSLH